jgi:phosphoglycolate phosphatase-like HAD superfamily hydrolase
VLSVVLDDRSIIDRTALLCREMYERSAMKRLLVHDGIGMALDRLRGDRIEMGAVTHERHALALKQIESTGLDRFLTVLAPTAEGTAWDLASRLADSLGYLGTPPGATAFVGCDARDLAAAATAGLIVHRAGWAPADGGGAWDTLETPASLERFLPPR